MRSPLPDYLDEVLDTCAADSGEVATYIPELAAADPDRLALAMCVIDGTVYGVGDTSTRFTIQSISKPFIYALALQDRGFEAVEEKVGVEPSGEAFNEISLETSTGRPRNAMINAGAIAIRSMLDADRVHAGLAAFAGRELDVDQAVLDSELATSDRNHAIAYMLRSNGIMGADAEAAIEGYTRQCSYLVDVADLATMANTFANGGVQPRTGERVVDRNVARQALSVMTTCGMYDAAGDWFTSVGIPAKSGVSGGLIGALPGFGGAAAFSPRLDSHGNTVRGVKMFERLSNDMGMHLMETPPPERPRARGRSQVSLGGERSGEAWVYDLQGRLGFLGMEKLLREVEAVPQDAAAIVFDLTSVSDVRDVGVRMLLEGARRLMLEDREVTFLDPAGILADRPEVTGDRAGIDVGDGTLARLTDASRARMRGGG